MLTLIPNIENGFSTLFIIVSLLELKDEHPKLQKWDDILEMEVTNYHELVGIPTAAEVWKAEDVKEGPKLRIAGGHESKRGQNPYFAGIIVTLESGMLSICGASILSRNRLVTAAHCWVDANNMAEKFEIVMGSLRLFTGGLRVITTTVIVHPSYNRWKVGDDIAIVHLPLSVEFDENIQRIHLPYDMEDNRFIGIEARIVGFGKQDDAYAYIRRNQTLRYTEVVIVKNRICAKVYGSKNVRDSIICTQGKSKESSTCAGDSGGPLAINVHGRWILLGTAAFGAASGCGQGYPSTFTRITSYIRWIRKRLK